MKYEGEGGVKNKKQGKWKYAGNTGDWQKLRTSFENNLNKLEILSFCIKPMLTNTEIQDR